MSSAEVSGFCDMLWAILRRRSADLFKREERFTVLPNDPGTIEAAVRSLVARNTG
jgi:hypothetical protein